MDIFMYFPLAWGVHVDDADVLSIIMLLSIFDRWIKSAFITPLPTFAVGPTLRFLALPSLYIPDEVSDPSEV